MMNPSGVSGGSPPWCRSAQSAATAIRYSKRFPHSRHLRLEADCCWELDRIDAIEATQGATAADSSWDTVEHWLASQSDAEAQGLSWQRRGHLLAKRGDLDGTRDAYRRAMVAWSQLRDYSEQVGDCVLSLQAAESLLGVWDVDATARSLAFSLESSHRTPAGDARRLQERAASNRIARRFIDAHREYWLAYAAYKRCGSLRGVLHVSRQLAELYVATGHSADAVPLLVIGGDEKEALRVGKQLPVAQLNDTIGAIIGQPRARWEQIVAYQLLQVLGTGADTDSVAAVAEQLLEDASPDPPTLINAQLPDQAKAALAAVSLQIPEHLRGTAFDQIRKDLRQPLLIDAGRQAGLALIRATQLEVLDAREELLDSLLATDGIPRVEPYQLADLLAERPEVRERIVQAAVAGSMVATQTLLWAHASGEPSNDVQELATEFTRRASAIETITTQVINGQKQISRVIGVNFAPGGLAARFAADDATRAFVERVKSVIIDNEETEATRASAANGLFNCSSRLAATDREELWLLLGPICRGEYESLTFGSPAPDPLSAVQFTSNEPGTLRAAALELQARVWELGVSGGIDELRMAVLSALRDPNAEVRTAAVESAGRVSGLVESEELARMLPDSEAHVRRAVILALGHREPDRLRPLLSTAPTTRSTSCDGPLLPLRRRSRSAPCFRISRLTIRTATCADLRSWQLIGWPADSPLDLQGSAVSAASLRRV